MKHISANYKSNSLRFILSIPSIDIHFKNLVDVRRRTWTYGDVRPRTSMYVHVRRGRRSTWKFILSGVVGETLVPAIWSKAKAANPSLSIEVVANLSEIPNVCSGWPTERPEEVEDLPT